MSMQDTGPRILLASLVALALFAGSFFVARGSSPEAQLPAVREQPLAGSDGVEHAPLREIGAVPALPRATPKSKQPRRPSTALPPPPPPPPAPVVSPRPPPPPPPPRDDCLGEVC